MNPTTQHGKKLCLWDAVPLVRASTHRQRYQLPAGLLGAFPTCWTADTKTTIHRPTNGICPNCGTSGTLGYSTFAPALVGLQASNRKILILSPSAVFKILMQIQGTYHHPTVIVTSRNPRNHICVDVIDSAVFNANMNEQRRALFSSMSRTIAQRMRGQLRDIEALEAVSYLSELPTYNEDNALAM